LRRWDGTISEPAWKTNRLVLARNLGQDDPPPAQRFHVSTAGDGSTRLRQSRPIYVSRPDAVAAIIKKAAGAARAADDLSSLVFGLPSRLTDRAPNPQGPRDLRVGHERAFSGSTSPANDAGELRLIEEEITSCGGQGSEVPVVRRRNP